ncbi:MAG: DUF1588 domain-containing protein [Planctomycetota bacterium]|nr:DUF1588 domain-containing protein [Planctomycetota bacterium]
MSAAVENRQSPKKLIRKFCLDCHEGDTAEGGLDLARLPFQPEDRKLLNRWVLIHDRIEAGEMPPDPDRLPQEQRQTLLKALKTPLVEADRTDIGASGRGPWRRLTREEFEQNLRDLLKLPQLDIRDRLPEDREAHRFNRTSSALDMSRVQLAAYLAATEAALQQAMANENGPPPVTRYRAVGTRLFSASNTFGGPKAMFFASGNRAVNGGELAAIKTPEKLELALFRSAHWPYYGYPRGFVAKIPGNYRVRFSARAVLQGDGFQLQPAEEPLPMTFRARKPSGPDVSGDVRATGGLLDIQPQTAVYETNVRLLPRETLEYSPLGLPVPLARNVDGGPPTYRYPPFPEGGQPGLAIQWLEIEGPIPPASWPPPSHRVLFDEWGPAVQPLHPVQEARRLLERFVNLAAREPVPAGVLDRLNQLIQKRLREGHSFADAMKTGYRAFLCSSHFLYLRDPSDPATGKNDSHAIASKLSHFLHSSRPDPTLIQLAAAGNLRRADILQQQTDRLIHARGFDRFVHHFTDYWLDLRYIRRHEPDTRLHPEYRFDNYLVESMERETRVFFRALIRDNLPASLLVDADFVYANDRLSRHYGLTPLSGSGMKKIPLPDGSPYGGLLTQAALMKVTANGTSTSPVLRGAWVMERLMGEPPPPPPDSVPAVEPDIRGARTIREQLALHTQSESCSTCHARFDPLGVALENFDILGRWRTRYRGIGQGKSVTGIDRAGHDYHYRMASVIDASSQLQDGRQFQNIQELKDLLVSDPRPLARNLLKQFTLYATGTPIRFSEREQIESLLDACHDEGYRVGDLLHALVQSPIFLGKEGCR